VVAACTLIPDLIPVWDVTAASDPSSSPVGLAYSMEYAVRVDSILALCQFNKMVTLTLPLNCAKVTKTTALLTVGLSDVLMDTQLSCLYNMQNKQRKVLLCSMGATAKGAQTERARVLKQAAIARLAANQSVIDMGVNLACDGSAMLGLEEQTPHY
ncbi:hypothetical protein KIPB_013809, partial [Kipferlia bialata]